MFTDRQRRAGFTLTELLIVILIIASLIALLMPALSSAWSTAYTTECKTHLKTIYQASVTFQNDKGRVMFPVGSGWVAALLPYVEGKMTAFTCPAALPPKTPADAGTSGSWVLGSSTGGTSWNAADKPPDTSSYCLFAFDIFSGKNTSVAPYLYTLMVQSEWARSRRTGANTWHYMIEDLGPQGGGDRDYNDIDVEVTYKDGLPTQVKIIQQDQSNTYGYNLTINGVTAVTRLDNHRGQIVPLTGSDGDANRVASDNGVTTFYYPLPNGFDSSKPSNYGMNKGTYDVADLNITKPDAKLIFILDHHELVVDAFDGNFDKYFIRDADIWNTMAWAKDGADWHEYQALRHFSQANVLFCDGHIESRGYWDLDPENPAARTLWRSAGN